MLVASTNITCLSTCKKMCFPTNGKGIGKRYL